MALHRLVFSLLVLSVVQCIASTEVPVFLWGNLNKSSIKNNPLRKITTEEFDNVVSTELKQLTEDPFTVIFIEDTLSVEDFSSKNSDGESSFPYLQSNLDNAIYIPSVENALRVLNRLADPEKEDHVKLTENGLSADIKHEGVKFLFINLKDAQDGESRADMLRRHNDFMEDMFTKLKKQHGEVVGIYTAHYPSWTISETHYRSRRQAESLNHDYTFDHLKLYVGRIQLMKGQDVINLSQMTANSTNFNASSNVLNTTLTFTDDSLTLDFVNKAGYWFFDMVTLSTNATIIEYLYPKIEIYALNGFSYRCAENVTFTTFVNDTNKYTVSFEDLKIQAFFEENPNVVFGDSFNCVGFFTAPIWAGLFVVFILLSITFYGIMMMMDIRTMDRFDDPKGKTITINAGE